MYNNYPATNAARMQLDERIRFMWQCHERLHIYQDSTKRLIKLCEQLLVFGSSDPLPWSSTPSADVVAQQNMWAEHVTECLREWSNMQLVATLVRWNHIRSILEELYTTCPDDTTMAVCCSPVKYVLNLVYECTVWE